MSLTTEHVPAEEPEFSWGFIILLMSLTVGTLVFGSLKNEMNRNRERRGTPDEDPMIGVPAWIYAAGQTIGNGIQEFSGRELKPVPESRMRASLISILVAFIVAPTLCLAGIRARAITPSVRSGPVHWRASHAVYLLGMFITIVVIVMGVASAVIQRTVAADVRQSQAIQQNKDDMINDLNWVAIRARQYRILPNRFGGGAGTYQGFVLAPELVRTEHATYTTVMTDSSVIVCGQSNPYGSCSIKVMVTAGGKMQGWTYTGDFQ